jgi:glycosyltransferase involved in cell wall biosynthesis
LPIFNYYPLYKQLKKFKPDIICSHSPFVIGSLITKFGRKHNIPVVATFHTHFYDEFLKITHSKFISKCLLKSIVKVFNNANYLHVLDPLNTSTIREYAINDFGKNIIFCDNGTEYKDVPNHNEIKTFINSKYNIADNDFVFSFVGRFVQCKNIDLIIKAATKINNDHVKYFLVGDGVEMKRLRNLVSANKLNDKFIFTGIIDDRALLQKIFIRTDCNILISDFDTFPLTILEAAASKTPSLMLKNYTSLINDSINGYLVDDMKIDTVKDKINFILNDKNINLVSANAFAEIFKPRT